MNRVCTFTLGERLLGVDASVVREIVTLKELTAVPGASSQVRGLLNLRGQIVTCLNLASVLGFELAATPPQLAVVVDDGSELVSFAIDRISDVVELEPGSLEPIPMTVPRGAVAKLAGACQRPGQLLLLVDLPRVLDGCAAGAEPHR